MADRMTVSRELFRLAVQVALEAPVRQSKYSVRAGITWRTIHELRAELKQAGVDWEQYHVDSKTKAPKIGDGVEYRCDKGGHVSVLRLTTLRPQPDRWDGDACGFCLRAGVDNSVMRRTGKVIRV